MSLEFEPPPQPQPPQVPTVGARFRIPGGDWLGGYTYTARGRIATLGLNHPDFGSYKLIFRTATSGQLFQTGNGSGAATFLIGTFTVPQ